MKILKIRRFIAIVSVLFCNGILIISCGRQKQTASPVVTESIVAVADNIILSGDWPQYLGPGRNGLSSQKNLLRSWPQQGPQVLWSADVGIGFGGPVIKDGKIYLLDRNDEVGDIMRCFNLSDGREIWKYAYNAPGSVMFPGSRSVPTVDSNRIYSCGPYGDLYCLDLDMHEPIWHKNIWTDFGGGEIPTWAITQCPLVYDKLLIVASQAPQAGVVAYDKITGNLVWKTDPLGGVGYVSPSIIKVGEEDHVVMITASSGGGFGRSGGGGKVVGIEPVTGKILWEYTNWQCSIPIPSALDAGEGRALITGGYEAGAALIKVVKNADGNYSVTELYKNKDFGAHTQPPVMYNGYFYAQYSTNERKDGLVCMGIDGEIKWKTGRNPLFDKGGMVLAEGLILATDGDKTLYLIEADPTAFKPVASAELLTVPEGLNTRYGTQNWAPLALADGRLLIRDQSRLLCLMVAQ